MKYYFLFILIFNIYLFGADTVPNEIQLPGTQPNQVPSLTTADNCDNCHGGTSNPDYEPNFPWRGSLMGNASRDPLFWATLAIAEQDFIPNGNVSLRGGAGDLCLRCHTPNGWISGRSTPTNGGGLSATADTGGVECELCHLMVNPDQPLSISGTQEVQISPFLAYDFTTGEGFHGSGEYVLNGTGVRLGPYANHTAKHQALPSPFHRNSDFCGTCHDVSNPATGDLAPKNGAQEPLPEGSYSGILGSALTTKAGFKNFPYKYGIVERTYSEWKSSGFSNILVNNFNSLPGDLKPSHGSIYISYQRAYSARSNANYEDGTPRYFTCQTCHMSASTGVGCNKSGTPVRTDLPRHDFTGSGYWTNDLIKYMDLKGTLRFGEGLSQIQKDAMTAAQQRAEETLKSALDLSAWQEGDFLKVKITNLTGHKLITGYPEGRRMWINIKWYNNGVFISENGGYGPIGKTARDLNNVLHQVNSIIDPESTVIYEAKMGLTKEWAQRLINEYGYSPNLVLSYNRLTDEPEHTLGELANSPDGTAFHSFHFVLNDKVIEDRRIPPYGFSYDEAKLRNSLPVPETLFGNPGPGGIYNHWDIVSFPVPPNVNSAQVRVFYQPTSWEYIQFLYLQNDGQDPFLSNEGVNLLDGWLNTGQAPPLELRFINVSNLTPPSGSPPGEPSHQLIRAEHMRVEKDLSTGNLRIYYTPGCDAVGHAIYYGPLSNLSNYDYSGSFCSNDVDGYINFNPPNENIFFVLVALGTNSESSYGKDSKGFERPEALNMGFCDLPQNLSNLCDP